MAHISIRISGVAAGAHGRVTRRFRDTDAGRAEARTFERGLRDSRRSYDVETRYYDKDPRGRAVSKAFKSRQEAEAYAAEIETDKRRGQAIDPRRAKITLKDYARKWLASRRDLAETTRGLYEHLLEVHVLPALGALTLAELTTPRVRIWHNSMASAHPTNAAKCYRLLSTVIKAAVADRLLPYVPFHLKGAAKEVAPERPVASIPEVRALADAMPDEQRIAILLAAYCQLRRGEILGLRRQDIDPLHGTLTVATTTVKTMDGQFIEKGPKSAAGRRTVAVPPNALLALLEHLDRCVGLEPDAKLLPGGYRPLRTAWDNARKATGLPYRLHDLRHAGLTWAAATGATVAELMHRGGHNSPVAALRYQHATQDRDRALADALANLATVTPIQPRDERGIDTPPTAAAIAGGPA